MTVNTHTHTNDVLVKLNATEKWLSMCVHVVWLNVSVTKMKKKLYKRRECRQFEIVWICTCAKNDKIRNRNDKMIRVNIQSNEIFGSIQFQFQWK